MSTIKTVYFDLGNVLVFFSFPKMLEQMSHCTGIEVDRVEQILFKSRLREQYEKGQIGTEQVYRQFLKEGSRPFSLQDFQHAFAHIFTPNTEIWPVVEELKRRKVRLILLSNTSECHYNYVYSHYPILQAFDHKLLSYELGVWKPEPEIFQKALQYAQCPQEECFYTDDIPEFIANARKVGLPGEVFTGVEELKKQLTKRGCHFF